MADQEEQQFYIGDSVRFVKNKLLFEKGTAPKWSETTHKIIKANKHSYVLDNGKRFKYYELLPAETVQKLDIIETRSKTAMPSIETIRKQNTIKRRMVKERIDQPIIFNKRERKKTDKFHY